MQNMMSSSVTTSTMVIAMLITFAATTLMWFGISKVNHHLHLRKQTQKPMKSTCDFSSLLLKHLEKKQDRSHLFSVTSKRTNISTDFSIYLKERLNSLLPLEEARSTSSWRSTGDSCPTQSYPAITSLSQTTHGCSTSQTDS